MADKDIPSLVELHERLLVLENRTEGMVGSIARIAETLVKLKEVEPNESKRNISKSVQRTTRKKV